MKNHWLQQKKLDKATLDQIDRIMKSFDFAQVRKAIAILGFTNKCNDLETEARMMLEKVAREDDWGCMGQECGHGFTAEKLPNGTLVLHYAVELWGENL